MQARWATKCSKCDVVMQPGTTIKPQYKRHGMTADNKPNWVRVPKAYVHAPRCPKVTPNRPGQCPPQVDPQTGEILMPESAATSQGSLL